MPQDIGPEQVIRVTQSTVAPYSHPLVQRWLVPLAQSNVRLAVFIFAVSLVVRLACYSELCTSVFIKYPSHAANFLNGEGEAQRAFTCSPLYLYYWLAVAKVFGGSLHAGRIVQLVAGALNCTLIALIGKTLFDWRAGLLAGLCAAFYLPFIAHDGTFVAGTWVVLLNLASIACLQWDRRRPGAGLLLGALALGLSACARPNGLLLAPFFACFALHPRRAAGATWRSVALSATLFMALVVIPPALITLRNYRVQHDFVPVMSDGGVVAYIGNNELCSGFMLTWPRYEDLYFMLPGEVDPTHRIAHDVAEREMGRRLKPSEAAAYFTSEALRFIRERPAGWLWLAVRKLGYTWTGYEAHDVASAFDAQDALRGRHFPGFSLVGALGLVGAVWFRRRWLDLLPLAGLLFTYTVTGMLFTVVARYRLPMVPALLWLGAGLVVAVVDAARQRRWKAVVPAALGAAVLLSAMSYRNYPMLALDAQYRVERDHLGPAEGAIRGRRLDKAREQLEATIAARPPFAVTCRAHGLMAIVCEAMGDRALADKHRAIGRGYVVDAQEGTMLLPPAELAGDPVHDGWTAAAEALRAGRAKEAVAGFRRLCAWVPNLASLRHCLGVALLRAGEREDGLRQLRLARMKDPGCMATHEAIIQASTDPPAALVAEYEDLVRANPAAPGFKQGLALAEAKARRGAGAGR